MMLSAEIRWFWRDSGPPGLKNWFCAPQGGGFAAGGGDQPREDRYIIDRDQRELGIKARGGGGIEIKALVGPGSARLSIAPFVGPIELWTKINSKALNLPEANLLCIQKLRWLRKFDTSGGLPIEVELDGAAEPKDGRSLPARGCNVEFTEIAVGPSKETWCTFGFEAFGDLSTVENSLQAAAKALVERGAPPLEDGVLASYPSWLAEELNRRLRSPLANTMSGTVYKTRSKRSP